MEKWHSVGTEPITVRAGTLSCEHRTETKDDGKGDVSVSSKILPMGMVKYMDDGDAMMLVKVVIRR